MQAETGEIFGRAARWSIIPAVKAYRGPLPVSARGTLFTTAVAPHSASAHARRPDMASALEPWAIWTVPLDDAGEFQNFLKDF
jgi:hypothetical protein